MMLACYGHQAFVLSQWIFWSRTYKSIIYCSMAENSCPSRAHLRKILLGEALYFQVLS